MSNNIKDEIVFYDVTDSYENQEIVEQEENDKKSLSLTKRIKEFVKRHNKELKIVGGISLGVVLCALLKDRNKNVISEDDIDVLRETLDLGTKKALEEKSKIDVDKSKKSIISNSFEPIMEDETIMPEQVRLERASHEVSEHIRNLPNGWHASAEKIEAAKEKGIILEPGQTIVNSYHTGDHVA